MIIAAANKEPIGTQHQLLLGRLFSSELCGVWAIGTNRAILTDKLMFFFFSKSCTLGYLRTCDTESGLLNFFFSMSPFDLDTGKRTSTLKTGYIVERQL